MKALGKCSKCGKQLETNCNGCIGAGTGICYNHGKEPKILKVKWKVFPENEKELNDIVDALNNRMHLLSSKRIKTYEN